MSGFYSFVTNRYRADIRVHEIGDGQISVRDLTVGGPAGGVLSNADAHRLADWLFDQGFGTKPLLEAELIKLRDDAAEQQQGQFEAGYLWALDHVAEAIGKLRRDGSPK